MADVPLTPEQQAQIAELQKKLATTGFGGKMGAQLAQQAGKTAVEEGKTINAMNGEGQDSKFQYGGWEGGANEAAGRYRNQAEDAQGREGVKIDYGAADGTRGSALGMAALMARRARGETPSIAGMMADRQMGQVAAEQSSQQASARGPAALALAQQGAAANTAAAQSNISNAAQINGAQERLQAEQAAFGAYSGTTAQDAQRAQAQGGMDVQQRQQNDAMTLGMTGFETGVRTAQMNAGMAQVAQKAAGAANYNNLVNARKAAADAKDGQLLQAGANVAGTAATIYTGGAAAPVVAAAKSGGGRPGDSGNGISDEDAKVPASFDRSPNQSVEPMQSTYGPSTYQPDIHADAAARALSDVYGPTPTGGFDSVEHGIGALQRRNDEDLALIHSKERVGAPLSKKESWMRGAMERRSRMDAGQVEPGVGATGAAKFAPHAGDRRPTTGEAIGSSLVQMGKIFGNRPGRQQVQVATPHFSPIAAPTSLSDDKTKLAAAWDAGNTAAVDASRKLAAMPPEELKRVSEDEKHPAHAVAAAVRESKAGAYDEAVARSAAGKAAKHEADLAWMKEHGVAPAAEPRSPIERPAAWGPAPPPAEPDPEKPGLFRRAVSAVEGAPQAMSDGLGRVYDWATPAEEPMAEPGVASRFGGMASRMKASMLSDERTKLSTTSASRKAAPGETEAGNIDHYGRGEVNNKDGSVSTVRSMSFNDGPAREVLIPTAYDGAVHSEDEAIANYRKTGQHMGVFKTPEAATASAQRVHDDYENGRYKDVGHVEQRERRTTVSDERTKDAAVDAIAAAKHGDAMLDGIKAQGEGQLSRGAAVGRPRMSDAEAAKLQAQANGMMEQTSKRDTGASVGTLGKQVPHQDMAEFARSLRGVPYAYKPEFAEREGQAPGEVNVGPVAQEIEKSKVGATIVKPDPSGTGMRTLDQPKMVKALSALAADQQEQIDQMRSFMARRMSRGVR